LRSSNIFRNFGMCLAVGIFAASAGYAIDPDRAISQYVLDRWGSEEGFPRGPVYAITQTSDGYLWIGTEAGLVRFDGWNFRLIKDETGAFSITSVLGLTTDSDGYLWLRLQDLSVLRYRNGKFESPSGKEPNTNFSAMSRGSHGQILLAKMEEGAFTFRNGELQMVASAIDLPRSPVISLAQTARGDIWAGTRDAGLFRLGGLSASAVRTGLPDLKVDSLLPDGDGNLLIGTDGGIVRWNGKDLTTEDVPESPGHSQILAMTRDRDKNLWVGTDSRGLLRFNARGVSYLDASGVGSGLAVTAIFEDREGNLWIGSAGTLLRLRDSTFVTYSLPEGLPTDGSNPVFVDSEGRMWFPPITGGLWWAKGTNRGTVNIAGLENDVVYSITGGNGELWVGRQRGGLTELRPSGPASFTAKTYTHDDGLAQDSVYSVYRSRDGTVWAGTLSGGVSKLSGGAFTTYTTANGMASNTVASMLETSDGTMWFATPDGLTALAKGRWKTWTTSNGLPSENVNCLLEDSKGVLWAGTTGGLAFRGTRGFQTLAGEPAPLRAQILGLAEDAEGWIWMGTSTQVLRVKRDKLLSGTLAEGDIREYGLADGLRGVDGVKRHQSVFKDSMGRIWFSLNRGISVVDPARLTGRSAPVIAHVQTISADSAILDPMSPVRIPGGRKRITFGFAGLCLSVPERVRFRYLLENFDHEWSSPGAGREAVYTNLGPGHYRFRVVASNPDGVWSQDEAVVPFTVDPLFWQTWWFRMGAVAALVMACIALYRFRLLTVTRRLNGRFEERLAERTRIAQELHDTLLQGFLSASMQVHVATDKLPADSPGRPVLTRALELMRQVIDEGRNAVRGLRATRSASLDLEQAFSRIQDEMASLEQESESVAFQIAVEGDERPLHPVLRDEVYRIGREAVINAFRHARAKSIELELKYSKQLRLVVRDDGCGIEPRVVQAGRDGHWGLAGMRERADRIGARLYVSSSGAAGTEIELVVPGNVAFSDHADDKAGWFQGWRRRRSAAAQDGNGGNE